MTPTAFNQVTSSTEPPPLARTEARPTEHRCPFATLTPKAMPVILTTEGEVEPWLTAPICEALALQRPILDGALRIVARGLKKLTPRQKPTWREPRCQRSSPLNAAL